MAETVSVHVPLVEIRQEGGKYAGYITQAWFRYLVASSPAGTGTGTGVLHGNASGPPTWGPVDFATDTTGQIDLTTQVKNQLPVANGGLGGFARVIGGVPYFLNATTIASSTALAVNRIVLGGDAAGPSTPLALGLSGQTLHANPAGAPTWGFTDLTHDVGGILPVVNGGTGSAFRTGTGLPVFDTNAVMTGTDITSPVLHGGTWSSASINGQLFWTAGTIPPTPQLDGNDSALTTVVVGPTTIVAVDGPMFWIVHDKTSGGMAAGVMSASAGSVDIFNNIAGATFSRSAGNGLQATIGSAPTTRTLSAYAILTGSP